MNIFKSVVKTIIPEKKRDSLRHIKNKRVCFVGSGLQKIKDFLGSQKNVRYYEMLPSSQYMNEIAYDKFLKNDFIDSAYFEPFYMKQFIPS